MKPNRILISIYHRRAKKSMFEKQIYHFPPPFVRVWQGAREGFDAEFSETILRRSRDILYAKRTSGNQKFIIQQELII